MSEIPRARLILKKARKSEDPKFKDYALDHALRLLDREKPDFRAPPKRPPLTRKQVEMAKLLRAQGLALYEIAQRIGDTDIGRVSEAINGKRDGI